MALKNIAVFISGGGTNLQSLIDTSQDGDLGCNIVLVVSSNPKAYGLFRAQDADIPTLYLKSGDYETPDAYFEEIALHLEEKKVDYIVLAGFLKVLPKSFTDRYHGRIINIHPSLIPKYCGKGFYGMKVHEAVVANGETKSGATVHFVDDGCDTGPIILQEEVTIFPDDTPEAVQRRVLKVEHKLLPWAVKGLCQGKVKLDEEGKVQWIKKEY